MQSQESQKSEKKLLSPQILKKIISSNYFISHIIFPNQAQHFLQQYTNRPLTPVTPSNKEAQQVQQLPQLNRLDQREFRFKKIRVQKYQEKLIQNFTDFGQIATELFYFMFICLKNNCTAKFHQNMFYYNGENQKFVVIVEAVYQQEQSCNDHGQKAFESYLNLIEQLCKILKDNFTILFKDIEKLEMESSMIEDKFQRDKGINPQYLSLSEEEISSKIQRLDQFIEDIRKVEKKVVNSQQSFVQLQKSKFLSTNSVLYQIRNRSISIILFKYSTNDQKAKLKQAISVQKALTKHLALRKQTKFGESDIDQISSKLRTNFEKYIKQAWVKNPLYVKIVTNNNHSSFEFENLSKQEQVKLTFKIKLAPIQEKFLFGPDLGQVQTSKNKLVKEKEKQVLEYSVEYNQTKSKITVRLHTTISVEHVNTDFLLQNWNFLTFQFNYVCLEIGEKVEMMQKVKKFIILKTTVEFQKGQPVLFQCLRLVDILVAAYKSLEQQLKLYSLQNKMLSLIGKQEEINKRLNHYCRLMGQISSKFYYSC